MKFECDKTKIEMAIQKTARLANKHLTLPVLSCVYLNVLDDNKIVIKSTNLDIGVEIGIKIKTIEKGILAVPASVLLGVLSSIKENNLTFESKENNLKIYSNKNSAIIKCLPYEDFPSIPKLENSKSIKINCRDLISGFKSVWYSASNSNIKPELSSVYVYKNNENLVFVSTDSFRLAEKKINTKTSIDFPQTIIPYRNVSEIIKLLEDYDGNIDIIFEKNQAAFIIDNMYLVSRLIDGSFPDYKQIIPKTFNTTATILKEDLLNSIKASNVFSDSLNQVKLKVDIKNKSLVIESKNNDVGEYVESINASVLGDSLELNFNSKFIIDCIQSIPSDSLTLSFGGVGKPLAISGSSDKSFLYIVMPMNR
ncbi:MAG: DNA polymerase III subunit beta [Candidatus Zambryskibacteria bacterium RIFCSPHIGHO2_12_FULL_38_34]|uniref:Beta sliding clamp n=1 Tax=Candidatus Zambryskibacteria bacterium RIFCSPLOWO2_12_FULL_39_16 TaxID=1802775 RepID=A0A1G2URE6_9BACT|nr:MAG: DNA polymerase III subunit beta [Candidatus Zambryskibacteria bacterium RIFCSPHIGHO2_02_FULL_38_22]OHA98015.1 MAG: DNA polymerase III subunit beta [Candidatus Zambryskibacteria bacterium RIFCSPHIGHO2_12_FULL_38_34]OHB08060.1 MAG: DNA polymerase III subunit beta [Candidatus Zambryskibacteria bacterium RIFCSPLOWO2_02_FULL_38_13]OHB11912.1 MAG: DNA polymerase III subunit beta [Candidatus Zambryskibacteria bacterium RIFCSPLOWO2_12_FULL_39_16]